MKLLRPSVIASFVLLSAAVLLMPSVASAHVLKEDNGIAVVLHIPPDDNPMAGQPTRLELAFASSGEAFSLQHCTCGVAVQQNGKILESATIYPAATNDPVDGVATVRFPSAGVYELLVTGSTRAGSFGTFRLVYLERITSAAAQSSVHDGSDVIIISAGSLAVLIMVAANAIRASGRYSPEPIKKDKRT